MFEAVKSWLLAQGVNERYGALLVTAMAGIAVILLGVIANFIAKQVILRALHKVILRSQTDWDDALMRRRVFVRLSHLAPALIIHVTAPLAFQDYPTVIAMVETAAVIYMVVVGLSAITAFLNAALDIWSTFEISRRVHLQVIVQVVKIILWALTIIFILSYLLGRSPLVFVSGLGAFTAVLMLIFKDSILGLVAGIQLMSNNMVRVGDWIEMPAFGADGDVIDISLTTIKVQNWNKTISTIPAYGLITNSFKNWRGMEDSGGRRIKRAVIIDMNSIKFCDAEMIQRFKAFEHIAEYIERKQEEIAAYNQERQVDESTLINGRHLTNIGTFRAYLEAYLRHHPELNRNLTFLVRQLPPTAEGLPVEIYVFSKVQAWVEYEAIQADIFDHILAVAPLFDLRVFQWPAGADVVQFTAGGRS